MGEHVTRKLLLPGPRAYSAYRAALMTLMEIVVFATLQSSQNAGVYGSQEIRSIVLASSGNEYRSRRIRFAKSWGNGFI
ncbi:hypothetical protein UY3_17202 [Chelonia mydas]|uniref:Uncharacterized protein n=1 Tax=Chelonia mydas TaxID=8469 RepID=M7AKP5_CHEMY|nr:hypothetical protein UY3_17202 [Chelonia mydas]